VNSGAGFGAWTWYSYDGLKVVAEGTSSTSKMYYTTAPGDPGGIICRDASAGTNPLYYHYDRLGNVMAVSDSNGALCAPYTMDAFGNVLQVGTSTGYSATQSDPQPYHLTTKEWDPDSGLFYFNARWYDRGTGRFVSQDVTGPTPNAYVYCRSVPTEYIDVDGRDEVPYCDYGSCCTEGRHGPPPYLSEPRDCAKDVLNFYAYQLVKANWAKSDKFFHCLGMCRVVTMCGSSWRDNARDWGILRERWQCGVLGLLYLKGPDADGLEDLQANNRGLAIPDGSDPDACCRWCSSYIPNAKNPLNLNLAAKYSAIYPDFKCKVPLTPLDLVRN
jgi:RHS repeat-associated protein